MANSARLRATPAAQAGMPGTTGYALPGGITVRTPNPFRDPLGDRVPGRACLRDGCRRDDTPVVQPPQQEGMTVPSSMPTCAARAGSCPVRSWNASASSPQTESVPDSPLARTAVSRPRSEAGTSSGPLLSQAPASPPERLTDRPWGGVRELWGTLRAPRRGTRWRHCGAGRPGGRALGGRARVPPQPGGVPGRPPIRWGRRKRSVRNHLSPITERCRGRAGQLLSPFLVRGRSGAGRDELHWRFPPGTGCLPCREWQDAPRRQDAVTARQVLCWTSGDVPAKVKPSLHVLLALVKCRTRGCERSCCSEGSQDMWLAESASMTILPCPQRTVLCRRSTWW